MCGIFKTTLHDSKLKFGRCTDIGIVIVIVMSVDAWCSFKMFQHSWSQGAMGFPYVCVPTELTQYFIDEIFPLTEMSIVADAVRATRSRR